MNKKKKVFVYDRSGAFSRMIRIKYTNELNVDVCKRGKNFCEKFSGKYVFAFAVVNSEEDLAIFSNLYVKVNFVFVVSNLVDVNFVLSKFNNVCIIDIKKTKHEAYELIKSQLTINNISLEFN